MKEGLQGTLLCRRLESRMDLKETKKNVKGKFKEINGRVPIYLRDKK